jgi:hypothetical protein
LGWNLFNHCFLALKKHAFNDYSGDVGLHGHSACFGLKKTQD